MVQRAALYLIPMILSLTVHEYAHAWTAFKFGDPTAKEEGRLTLNPSAHMDPIGSLLIPLLSVVGGGVALLAWARPTPCRPDRMHPTVPRRLACAIVSAAGPLSNLLLALLCAATLALLNRLGFLAPSHFSRWPIQEGSLVTFLSTMFTLNLALALFNLLPVPPLDGSKLLPPFFDPLLHRVRSYGLAALLCIFLCMPKAADFIFYNPLDFLAHHLLAAFGL